MRKFFCLAFAAHVLAAAPPPKLVVAIAVDQFRYDYLTRFRTEYHHGFERLLTEGAVFTNARYEHYPTVTAVGHSTFLSGATPSMSGIVGNEWFDRDAGKNVASISDDTVKMLGGTGEGASPRRMLVSTVGDELKIARAGSKAIGISLKDRSAILPAGHMADGAYWFDPRVGSFVSSTYYFAELPDWVKTYNATRPADGFRGAKWLAHTLPQDSSIYAAIEGSPYGNELVEAFVERAIQAEKLGQRGVTDLLAVSFSANDYVGHSQGPDSPEVKEMSIQTDRVFGKLFNYLDATVGMANVLVVMTADHGVAPVPEVNTERRMPGGRMQAGVVHKAVEAALSDKYGAGPWLLSPSDTALYFNQESIRQKKLDPEEVERTAADAVRRIPHVFRAYTGETLASGVAMEDLVGRRVANGFYAPRSPDLYVLLEPYWLYGAKGTTHSTTFSYDAHVPVIFMGPGIKAGRFNQSIAVNDIAPTLATYLDIETPSGSAGRCLREILDGAQSTAEGGARAFMQTVAHDITAEGPAAWRRYFSDTPAFFMAVDGKLAFTDSATATVGIQEVAKMIKHIELQWGDVRVDPLAPDLAVVAAPYHEIQVNAAGARVSENGYFTGVAEQHGGRWQFRDAHWSGLR